MEPSSIVGPLAEGPGYLWISEEISFAITPVFLLTAIATLLLLFSSRMGRVADRFVIEEGAGAATPVPKTKALLRRMRLIQAAIVCAVSAGLLVSTVVMLIFISDTVLGDLSIAIAVLFIAAMGLIWLGLLLFLAEISYAAAGTARDLSD